MAYYFDKYENKRPPKPLAYNPTLELMWQFAQVFALVLGGWYIYWRWTASINFDALWFSIPLLVAETGAYIGLFLFTFNLWRVKDTEKKPPPENIRQCVENPESVESRPISVDIFFPTYDEEPELVRLSIADAQAVRYPHDATIKIHVLDDGSREDMKRVAEEMGVNYITREGNIGFKAGNMRNGMEQTSGDFLVICDADTRPFPSLLENTLGYFRDPDVAWVQTPQWFFDLPEGLPLHKVWEKHASLLGKWAGLLLEKVVGPIQLGDDPFANDPQMFYDVIQRRRNWANASFCCGAGSIHRRDAVMEVALKSYGEQIEKEIQAQSAKLRKITKEKEICEDTASLLRKNAVSDKEFTPYKFHVSEDIYTSIVLHGDETRNWKSVLHPDVESKMLSPQDLQTWIVQRFKYAGGTLDISLHDSPLSRKGMSWSQKLMYGATIWAYVGVIWTAIFLLSPIIYLFTGIAPVSAYSVDFFIHLLPFIFMNEFATMLTTWGVKNGLAGKTTYLSFFPVNIKAIWTVLRGQEIKFPVTSKERQDGSYLHLVVPQLTIIVLSVLSLAFAMITYLNGNPLNQAPSGIITNTLWCAFNVISMSGIVMAALWHPDKESLPDHMQTKDSSWVDGDSAGVDSMRNAA